jgi:hypothetical protein
MQIFIEKIRINQLFHMRYIENKLDTVDRIPPNLELTSITLYE